MKKLIKDFKNFFMNYDTEEKDIDLLILALENIIAMMNLIDLDDYDYIEKIMVFINTLMSDNEIIDEDRLYYNYFNDIMPILEYFESKYEDYSSKTVAESVHEFIETRYIKDINNIFRNYKFIDNTNTSINNKLDLFNINLMQEILKKIKSILNYISILFIYSQNNYYKISNQGFT